MFFFSPDLRVSDVERDSAVDFLKEHYAAGRLDEREFDARVDAAHRAQFESQLVRLTADLPAVRTPLPEQRRRSFGGAGVTAAVALGAVAFIAMVPGEIWAPLLTLLLPLAMMLLFFLGPILLPVLAFFGIARAIGGAQRRERAQLPPHSGMGGFYAWGPTRNSQRDPGLRVWP